MFKIIVLAFIAVCTVVSGDSGYCGYDKRVTWILEDGVLSLKGTGTVDNHCDLSMEQKYSVHRIIIGGNIKGIDKSTFREFRYVKEVFISDKVEAIGREAFAPDLSFGGLIESLYLGKSVKVIDDGAFIQNKLNSLTIPNSVKKIGEGAFSQNSIKSLTLGKSVELIGKRAFLDNELTSLTIPNSVKTIGARAFEGNNLTSLTIPNSVEIINSGAFSNNPIKSLTLGKSVEEIDDYAFINNKLTSLTIPNSVKGIGREAFRNNSIESLTIDKSVKWIDDLAFYENKKLHSVAYLGYEDPCSSETIVFDKTYIKVCVPLKYNSDTFCHVEVVKDPSPLSRCGITKY